MSLLNHDDERVLDRRLAALFVLAGWGLLLVYFRFEMLLLVPWQLGVLGAVSIVLRDVSLLAFLAICWLLAARLPGRTWAWLFWLALVAFAVVLGAFSLFEHTYFQRTGSRLRRSLAVYSLLHFDQLKLVIASGLDASFRHRLSLAAACTTAPWILWWRFRQLHLSLPRRCVPVLVALMGVTWAVPVAHPLVQEGLVSPALLEFLAPAPDLESLLPPSRLPPSSRAGNGDGGREVGRLYRAPSSVSAPVRRPNIVLLVLESTGADVTTPWNPDTNATPFLTELATRSWRVESTYVSVSHTSKALVGILCGAWPRPPLRIDEVNPGAAWPLRCLPELLREAGYRTAFIQSASESFEGRPGLLRRMGYQHAAYSEQLVSRQFPALGYFSLDDRSLIAPTAEVTRGPLPVFLTLLTSATHHPYALPGQPWPELGESASYYRIAIQRQDLVIRHLFNILRQSPLADDLLFIVLGDHGEAFGQHLLLHHDSVPYEEVTRVPWLMWGPELLGLPRTIAGLRHQLDLVPTVLDLLGMEHEGHLPGRSLRGPGHDSVASFCWGADTCGSLRRGNLKTTYFYETRPTQFFDLLRDPGELDELSRRLDDATRVRMTDELLGLRRQISDFWAWHDLHNSPAVADRADEAEADRPGFVGPG